MKNRKQIRLKDFNYAQAGYYFVTICSYQRKNVFGEIENGEVSYSDLGLFAHECWYQIPVHYPQVELDEFIVMPNHIHGIIVIQDLEAVGTQNSVSLQTNRFQKIQANSLSSIVRGYKIGVTKLAREIDFQENLWQPRFYDHVIRNLESLEKIREYIDYNPLKWEEDLENRAYRQKLPQSKLNYLSQKESREVFVKNGTSLL